MKGFPWFWEQDGDTWEAALRRGLSRGERRHDSRRDRAEMLEDLAHVERPRQGRQQIMKCLEGSHVTGKMFSDHRIHARFLFRAAVLSILMGSPSAISWRRSRFTEMKRCWPASRTTITPASARIFK